MTRFPGTLRGVARTLVLVLACGLALSRPVASAQEPPPSPATPSKSGKRVALVIGNNAYVTAEKLRNCVNDARSIKQSLEQLGFTVRMEVDADRSLMTKAVEWLEQEAKGGELAVFFYSGHGIQIGGLNYLVPVDLDAKTEAAAKRAALCASDITDGLTESGCRTSIVILDACRNNPFSRGLRGAGSRGLAPMVAAPGSLIAFAADANQTADDNQGGTNGLYTSALLKHLTTPDLQIEDVFKRTRREVNHASGGRQVPAEYTKLEESVYLHRTGAQATPPGATPAAVAPTPAPVVDSTPPERRSPPAPAVPPSPSSAHPIRTVYFTVGHGEKSIEADGSQSFRAIVKRLEQGPFRAKSLDLSTVSRIPDECSVLVVAGPTRPFPPAERDRIRDYLKLAGKGAMFLVDPRPQGGLSDVLRDCGVRWSTNVGIEANAAMALLGTRACILGLAQKHVTTRDLQAMKLPVGLLEATHLGPLAKTEGRLAIAPLLESTKSAWAERDLDSVRTGKVQFSEKKDTKGPLSLGVAVEIEQPPASADPDGRSGEADRAKLPSRSRVVVIGDSDFVTDRVLAELKQLGNERLFLNAIVWLSFAVKVE